MKIGYTISRASRKYPTFKILKGVNDMANMIVDNAKVMSKGQIKGTDFVLLGKGKLKF